MAFVIGNFIKPKTAVTANKAPVIFNVPFKKEVPKPAEPLQEEPASANEVLAVQAEENVEKAAEETEAETALTMELVTEKKKRTRRTKAQIEADKESPKVDEKPARPETAKIVLDDESTLKSELADEMTPEFTSARFSPNELNLDKLKQVFAINLVDEEWDKKKEELETRVKNIRIEDNINLGSVRILLAQTTNLYSDLKREQRANKTFYNILLDKSIGLIARQKELNLVGKNSEDRKKNSQLSCEAFQMKTEKGLFNLYDISMVMQDRVDTINDLLDDVKQKKETLVSFLAVLKLENGMVK